MFRCRLLVRLQMLLRLFCLGLGNRLRKMIVDLKGRALSFRRSFFRVFLCRLLFLHLVPLLALLEQLEARLDDSPREVVVFQINIRRLKMRIERHALDGFLGDVQLGNLDAQ